LAPLDFRLPIPYKPFAVSYEFFDLNGFLISKLSENQFRLYGELGKLFLDSNPYDLDSITIKSPSDHKIQKKGFKAELQVRGMSPQGSRVILVILIDTGDESPFLTKLGFGQQEIRQIPKNTKGQYQNVTVNLSQLFSTQEFILYQGLDIEDILSDGKNGFLREKRTIDHTQTPCEVVTYLVSLVTIEMDDLQYSEFIDGLKSEFIAEISNSDPFRVIYQNSIDLNPSVGGTGQLDRHDKIINGDKAQKIFMVQDGFLDGELESEFDSEFDRFLKVDEEKNE
jgi:hypothetical protein